MERYRIRYSRIASGLRNTKQTFCIDFNAGADEAVSLAKSKWEDVEARKYLGLEFIDLVKVLDWRPQQ